MSWICHVGSHLQWRLREKAAVNNSVYTAVIGYGNGLWIPVLFLYTVKCNWVIVTGPQSSLRESMDSNNQSVTWGKLSYTLGSWWWNRHRNANPYLRALEWESGWALVANWKRALRTIGSCKRAQIAIAPDHLPVAVKPEFETCVNVNCRRIVLFLKARKQKVSIDENCCFSFRVGGWMYVCDWQLSQQGKWDTV